MDASIYGSGPASNGSEGALDSDTSLLGNTVEDDVLSTVGSPCSDASTSQLVSSRTPGRVVPGKRKRCMYHDLHQEYLAGLRARLLTDIQQQELDWEQRERHFQMEIDEARRARDQEAALRAEENAQTAAFSEAFLNIMRTLVQVMSDRQAQDPLPD